MASGEQISFTYPFVAMAQTFLSLTVIVKPDCHSDF